MIELEFEEEIPPLVQELTDMKNNDQVDIIMAASVIRGTSTSWGTPPPPQSMHLVEVSSGEPVEPQLLNLTVEPDLGYSDSRDEDDGIPFNSD